LTINIIPKLNENYLLFTVCFLAPVSPDLSLTLPRNLFYAQDKLTRITVFSRIFDCSSITNAFFTQHTYIVPHIFYKCI